MKKITFFMVLVFALSTLFAQDECKDVIYPVDGTSIIFNCCIYEVKDGNIVHFVREGDSSKIAANSIIQNGKEIMLRSSLPAEISKEPTQEDFSQTSPVYSSQYEYDFDYYKSTYEKATRQRNAGIILASVGLGMEIVGIIIAADQANKADTYYYFGNSYTSDYDPDLENFGYAMIVVGSIMENVGIPLWISGGIKRANNRKAMNEIEGIKSISFGFTGNGVGLKFKL